MENYNLQVIKVRNLINELVTKVEEMEFELYINDILNKSSDNGGYTQKELHKMWIEQKKKRLEKNEIQYGISRSL